MYKFLLKKTYSNYNARTVILKRVRNKAYSIPRLLLKNNDTSIIQYYTKRNSNEQFVMQTRVENCYR